jgi:hypothetical protein
MTHGHQLSKLKTVFMRAASKKRRRELDDHLATLGDTLSPTGAAVVEFAAERPGLSVLQKDRVAAVIADLDNERNLIKALVTEAQSEWPDVPADLPVGTQPDSMVRDSLYYSLETEEADWRWNRRFKIVTLAVVVVGFLITWGLLIYALLQMRP